MNVYKKSIKKTYQTSLIKYTTRFENSAFSKQNIKKLCTIELALTNFQILSLQPLKKQNSKIC